MRQATSMRMQVIRDDKAAAAEAATAAKAEASELADKIRKLQACLWLAEADATAAKQACRQQETLINEGQALIGRLQSQLSEAFKQHDSQQCGLRYSLPCVTLPRACAMPSGCHQVAA
jgi:hypothetical protein